MWIRSTTGNLINTDTLLFIRVEAFDPNDARVAGELATDGPASCVLYKGTACGCTQAMLAIEQAICNGNKLLVFTPPSPPPKANKPCKPKKSAASSPSRSPKRR